MRPALGRADLRLLLEQDDGRASLRELEGAAGPDGPAADDEDVLAALQGTSLFGWLRGFTGVPMLTKN